MADWIKVSDAGDPPPGQVKVVTPRGERIALANVNGEYYAIDDVCTHDGGSLDQGEVLDYEIECPRHGAHFDLRTGEALTLPAVFPVKAYAVKVVGQEVFIDL